MPGSSRFFFLGIPKHTKRGCCTKIRAAAPCGLSISLLAIRQSDPLLLSAGFDKEHGRANKAFLQPCSSLKLERCALIDMFCLLFAKQRGARLSPQSSGEYPYLRRRSTPLYLYCPQRQGWLQLPVATIYFLDSSIPRNFREDKL